MRLQGLQRQISQDEKESRERLAGMAERTSRSFSEQEQRLRDIAQQGASRIQRSRDEGVGKVAAVRAAAVQASDVTKAISHLPLQHCSGSSHCSRWKGTISLLKDRKP